MSKFQTGGSSRISSIRKYRLVKSN